MSTGASSAKMEVEQDRDEVANPRRCAACKYLRRRCALDCILAPYFPASHPQRYADVHTVFGTSNVTRWLQSLPQQERGPAAEAMAAEAHWRLQDQVYGSAGVIHRLQEEISAAQAELARTRAEVAIMQAQSAPRQGPGAQPQPSLPAPGAVHTGVTLREDEDAPLTDADGYLNFDGLL